MNNIKRNENLLIIGAPGTGKTLLLKNLYITTDGNKILLTKDDIKSCEHFLNFLNNAEKKAIETKEYIIFIDSENLGEILLSNDSLFPLFYKYLTDSKSNLIFYMAVVLSDVQYLELLLKEQILKISNKVYTTRNGKDLDTVKKYQGSIIYLLDEIFKEFKSLYQ